MVACKSRMEVQILQPQSFKVEAACIREWASAAARTPKFGWGSAVRAVPRLYVSECAYGASAL